MERIFVIDDDALTLAGLRTSLSKAGYEVDTFDAIEKVPQPWPVGRWDCAICDWFIYDRTGQEMLEQIRASGDQVPVIFLTGNHDLRSVIEAIQGGASDYILKPFEPRTLMVILERNIRIGKERQVLARLQADQAALEAEKRQIVNWRQMYAAKETRQTEMMIKQLSRSINRSGGFSWLEMVKADLQALPEGRVSLSKDILDIMLEITSEQKRILDYLEFMSRIDSMPLKIESCSLEFLVEWVGEVFATGLEQLGKANGRRASLSLPRQIPAGAVKLDLNYLRAVLWELCVNAIKYSPDGTDIVIYPLFADEGGKPYFQLVVANEALAVRIPDRDEPVLGIPYEYCEQVFDMYYSIDPAGHTIAGEEWRDGTGLYIARRILRRMGGWIKAANGSDLSGGRPKVVVNLTLGLPL